MRFMQVWLKISKIILGVATMNCLVPAATILLIRLIYLASSEIRLKAKRHIDNFCWMESDWVINKVNMVLNVKLRETRYFPHSHTKNSPGEEKYNKIAFFINC